MLQMSNDTLRSRHMRYHKYQEHDSRHPHKKQGIPIRHNTQWQSTFSLSHRSIALRSSLIDALTGSCSLNMDKLITSFHNKNLRKFTGKYPAFIMKASPRGNYNSNKNTSATLHTHFRNAGHVQMSASNATLMYRNCPVVRKAPCTEHDRCEHDQ